MGLFGFGNKPLGTYPNGVPYDKRRYNPNHPNHLPPSQSSPAYGYPADAWMIGGPYTTTREFQWSQRQNDEAGMGGVDMRGSGGMGNNTGATGGMGAMSGMAGMGAPAAGLRRGSLASAMAGMGAAAGSRRGSLAGTGGLQGAGPTAGPETMPATMPGSAEPRPGAMPDHIANAAARSSSMGMGGPGPMRGGREPFGSQRFGSRTGRRRLN